MTQPLLPGEFPGLPRLPGGRPWRLGTTSYVYPADVLPNVEALAPQVQDIELVLFESEDVSNLPSPAVIARLAELGRQHDCTYTIHFPIDKKLGAESATERAAFVRQACRIVELTRPLRPFGFLLHAEGIGPQADAARVRQWQQDVLAALPPLIDSVGDPALLCLENYKAPFAWGEPLLERWPLSVCIDAGHLWRFGYDLEAQVRQYLPRTRVIHLHGERDGRDHISLAALAPERLREFLRLTAAFTGVVSLELFEFDAVKTSIETLTAALAGVGAAPAECRRPTP